MRWWGDPAAGYRGMKRNAASLSVVAGIVLLTILATLIVLSRSGENAMLSGSMRDWFGHPRAATTTEQREFLRLSLERFLGPPPSANAGAGAGKSAHRATAAHPRIAMNAAPSRLCDPMPQVRWCEPNAFGKRLIAKPHSEATPQTNEFERIPIALRHALVQVKPVSERLPDPNMAGVLVYNGAAKLSPEDERWALALLRHRVPGGLGHVFFTWAVISTDGRTALMEVATTGGVDGAGYNAIDVFERDSAGWRWVEKLRY